MPNIGGGYRQFKVYIGGTLVEVEPNTLSVTLTIGQRSQGGFDWHDYTGMRVKDGTAVQIYDENSVLVYSGFVDSDKRQKRSAVSSTLFHTTTLKDNQYIADRRHPGEAYLNVYAGAVVSDLFHKYLATEGVTVGGIAQGVYLAQSLVYNYSKPLSTILSDLAKLCGYWWDIDEQKQLWFQPYTGRAAPWVYDGTQADMSDVNSAPAVEDANPEYRNRQFTLGGFTETGTQTEYQYGDGKKRAFTLRYAVSRITTIYVNGVAQSVGTKGTDSGKQFYSATGDPVIAQDDGQVVLGPGDLLEVVYKGRYPCIALAQSATQINTRVGLEGGGTGYVEAAYRDPKLKTLSDAFAIASAQLAHYGQDIQTLTFRTTIPGLKPAQLLTCNDPTLLLNNTQMLVRSVSITEQDSQIWYDVTAIGSPADVTWQSFYQALANQVDGTDLSSISDGSVLALLIDVSEVWTLGGSITITSFNAPIVKPTTICGPTLLVG